MRERRNICIDQCLEGGRGAGDIANERDPFPPRIIPNSVRDRPTSVEVIMLNDRRDATYVYVTPVECRDPRKISFVLP